MDGTLVRKILPGPQQSCSEVVHLKSCAEIKHHHQLAMKILCSCHLKIHEQQLASFIPDIGSVLVHFSAQPTVE